MNAEATLNKLLEEMRNTGSLPALSESVVEISRLAKRHESSAVDLATVIMRDCGLASNLLAAVNSAYYAPRFPIKTITAAVTYLGFDKVYLISLGLGMFRDTMARLQKRNLLKLYAISYFSGILAMALAKEYDCKSPEEIFIAGLLYRLPGLALANTFPDRFQAMEQRMVDEGLTANKACRAVFQVGYDELCDAVMAFYSLPEDLERLIVDRQHAADPLITLVDESATLAAMIFGDRRGGKHAIQKAEKRIGKILGRSSFSVPRLIHDTFKGDDNVKEFFNLNADDVEMMVNILEWGKANPMEIVTHMDFGATLDRTEAAETPESLIGHFLTELALSRKRGEQINQLLMLAQEAIYRCLPDSEVFLAFLSADKKTLQGRFYVGSLIHVEATDFVLSLDNTGSPIVQALHRKTPLHWHTGGGKLGLPFTPFGSLPLAAAYLAPMVVRGKAIGICFVGRLQKKDFSERECVWIDQIVDHIDAAFSASQP